MNRRPPFTGALVAFGLAIVLILTTAGRADAPQIRRHRNPKPLAKDAVTSDWPYFLGPNHHPVSPETHINKDSGPDGPPLVWEMQTGSGYASPAIADGRLVYFHREADREIVDCIRAETGEHLWRHAYPSSYRDRYGFSNGPRSSPVISGKRVYTHGAEGALNCLSLETGQVIWSQNTSTRFDVATDFFGVGSTPLIEGDLLIVQVGAVKGPTVVAFDKATGDIKWQSGKSWAAGYASPVPAVVGNRRWVFALLGGDSRPPVGGLMVFNPVDGAVTSRFDFRSKTYESVNASSPVIDDDRVFISSSYGTGGICLGVGEQGDVSELWRTDDLGAHFTTPVIVDGKLFGVTGSSQRNSAVVCLDWATGKTLWTHSPQWTERVTRNKEPQDVTYTVGLGSLLAVDRALLLQGEMGHLAWLAVSGEGYRELSRTRLFRANETWCLPVISQGLLYICQNRPDVVDKTGSRLLCYDLRRE